MKAIKTKADCKALLDIGLEKILTGYGSLHFSKKEDGTYVFEKYVSCNSWHYTYNYSEKEMVKAMFSERKQINSFLKNFYELAERNIEKINFQYPEEYEMRKAILAI